jgi:hypothetical protein
MWLLGEQYGKAKPKRTGFWRRQFAAERTKSQVLD